MRSLSLLLLLSLSFCTGPKQRVRLPLEDLDSSSAHTASVKTNEDSMTVSSPATPDSSPSRPHYLPPEEWPGNLFYVLPKQTLMRSFGYELYSCYRARCDSHPVESFWELPNRRIRHKSIAGDTLYAEAAEPVGGEWLVTFIHTPTGRKIYGTTRKMAIEGIVFCEDLRAARSRWLNKTVYSKRGVISTFSDSQRSAISSTRLTIQEPLKVIDVKWGLSPLPVKPIWIEVEHSSGKRGFIPVRYNWTNTMSNAIKNQTPWLEDLFEQDPLTLFDWDENTWELINNHRVILEMTKDQVRLSWGTPLSESKSGTAANREIWRYASHELVFIGNVLTGITQRSNQIVK